MKKERKGEKVDDLLSDYDLRELLKTGAQGKYADCYREEHIDEEHMVIRV